MRAIVRGRRYTTWNCIDGVLIDPETPVRFYATANEKRSSAELQRWWDLPFVVSTGDRFDTWCLNGSVWDRPTLTGSFHTLDEAVTSITGNLP